ncbi:hypothetical protein [Actinoplanes sp. NPDC020271]|uniref:hypothetical protein n=1 Tax=Actinoplanes sp. NPDC020271 TaxID=3363896 RepID=UPI0037A7D938
MTITPPRGTPGAARTASRTRRRRPQPGEPRHAANAPAFEEAPAVRRRTPRPLTDDLEEVLVEEGLGAQLYEVMSDSERETAVAETLLFVRPAFDDEPPADSPLDTESVLTEPLPAEPLLAEPLLAEPLLAEAALAGVDLNGPAETVLFARPADRAEEPPPVRREVTPLTETFLFGPPAAPHAAEPQARHAQEPRSPVDGTAETLLFAGLARALATAEDEPAGHDHVMWDTSLDFEGSLTADHEVDGPGWADTPYREIVEKDHRIAEPGGRGWEILDRNAVPEEFAAGAAGLARPGRVVNRRRAHGTDLDRNALPPEEAWIPDYSQADEEATADEPAETDDPFGSARELSPEAEAAWKAFAHGDREPGTEIRTNRRAKSRWMTSLSGERPQPEERPRRRIFLWPVLLRCLLYLGPLSVAVAGADALDHVAWPVAAGTLLLGWSAAQALTSVGVTVARRAGPEAAVRLIGAGFAAVTALWCALVWIAPGTLLGPDRLLAASVGAGGLVTLATVTAALVTRAETAVIRWYLPCWLLAAAALAEDSGAAWAHYVPVGTLLPATVVVVLVRAFRPAVVPGRRCRIPRLSAVERRRGIAYLVIGVSQALCVALLWRAGPDVTPSLVALPLLLAVPMLEALIGWHTARIDAGLDSAETVADLDRHVRNVTVITLAGLLPPLAAGGALALAAYRLPYQISHLGITQPAVLALAAGTLLGGVFAITFLLAARSRTGIAATLAAAPSLATVALPLLPQPDAGPLPLAVAVLAATHVAGLLIVALTAADLRRTS